MPGGTPTTGCTDARSVSEVSNNHRIDINSTPHFIGNLVNGHPSDALNQFLWNSHMTYDLDTFHTLHFILYSVINFRWKLHYTSGRFSHEKTGL